MHWFHNHHTCETSSAITEKQSQAVDCCGCDHDHHISRCETGREKSSKDEAGKRRIAASEFGSSDSHCAVCRFLAQSSTRAHTTNPPVIGKAEPFYVVSEPSPTIGEPAPAWHSRAPPIFFEI
ncbi:MAG: hypothetical protein JXM70_26970 [Pirellulales bacterium]|nr:hypothetical protein [Pirellulales bacterium]